MTTAFKIDNVLVLHIAHFLTNTAVEEDSCCIIIKSLA